ncbi:MAG: FHA domain-containing protein [Nitrospinae bacterium]|nr:FHA domain-containing protein [Nitrospinota bacterium]
MAKLIISTKEKVLKEVDLKKSIMVGREVGDIVLKNPTVSAKHMKIELISGRFIVHDLNSTNGTFVNNEQVTSRELRHGDVIRVGKFSFEFQNPEQEAEPVDSLGGEDMSGMTMMIDSGKIQVMLAEEAKKKAAAASSTPAEPEAPKREAAKLFLYQASGAPKVMSLDKDTTLIGSSENSDIQIKGITIGRVAASITRSAENEYEIGFQGGMAKLKVDGKPADRHKLKNGDKFSISSYNFEFRTEL